MHWGAQLEAMEAQWRDVEKAFNGAVDGAGRGRALLLGLEVLQAQMATARFALQWAKYGRSGHPAPPDRYLAAPQVSR